MDPIINVPKEKRFQADYRWRVAEGEDHPLRPETERYEMVWLVKVDVSIGTVQMRYGQFANEFSEDEKNFLESHMRHPRIEWALDNSFDGLYCHRTEDLAGARMIYRIGAYLRHEHATFWRLKFS